MSSPTYISLLICLLITGCSSQTEHDINLLNVTSVVNEDITMQDFIKLTDECSKLEFAKNYSRRNVINLKTIDKMANYFAKNSGITGYKNLDLHLGRYNGDLTLFREDLVEWKKQFRCYK